MAYAVRAKLGSVASTTTGTHTVTATPAVNDLIVIACANTGITTNPTVTDNNGGGGGTYTQVTGALARASADKIFIYIRTGGRIASATSTVFSVTGASSTGGGMVVIAITGIATFASAVRQVGAQPNAAAGTPAPAFPAVALTQDVIVGAVLNATSPATLTQRGTPAYAEGCDLGFANPTTGFEEMHIATGETAQTINWGSASGSAFGAIVAEFNNNYKLWTTAGAFTESGQNAILKEGRKTYTTTGSIVLTGNNAILTKAGGLTNYILWTTAGSFALTGNNAKVLTHRKLYTTTVGV